MTPEEYFENRYLNGGGFKGDTEALYKNAHRMMNKAKIVQRLDEAISLDTLFEKLWKDEGNKKDLHPLKMQIITFYEPIVDDAILFSAFEMYSKDTLLRTQYIVHEIKTAANYNKGCKEQRKTPFHFKTYRKLAKEGVITGIKQTTIGGEVLLKEKYFEKINLKKEHIKHYDKIRAMRNRLHSVNTFYLYSVKLEWLLAISHLRDQIQKNLK